MGGGHSSMMSVSDTTSVVATAVQLVTQGCVSHANGSNVLFVSGDSGDSINTNQSISMQINSTCVAGVTQSSSFQNKLQAQISQQLKDKEVALTQFLDNSHDSTWATINQSVQTNVSSTTVQTCLDSINAQNAINVSGTDNTTVNAVQSQSAKIVSSCLLKQGQASKAINDITSSVNQHSTYDSENPLAFIGDAVDSALKSAMMMIAAVFIVLICFVGLFMALRGKKKERHAKGAAATSPPSAAEAPL